MSLVPKQRDENLAQWAKRLRAYENWKRRQDKIEIYRTEVAEPSEGILDVIERRYGSGK